MNTYKAGEELRTCNCTLGTFDILSHPQHRLYAKELTNSQTSYIWPVYRPISETKT